MKTQLKAAIAICVLYSTSAYGGQIVLPATLEALLPDGDFAMVGDLKFDNFTYIMSGDMPIPAQINVEEVTDGVRFTGPFLDLPGGIGNGASDATIGFTVTTSTPISIVTLSGNPSRQGGGNASVTETFAGIADIKLDIFDDASGLNLISSVSIPSTNSLTVVKDVLLFSDDPVDNATLSVIEQTFVPEPTTMGLLLFGFLGMVALRRRFDVAS